MAELSSIGRTSELIIVDDRSEDTTVIDLKYQLNKNIVDRNVVVVELPKNVGATAAKQIGAQAARGRWIIFMDSDDYFVSDVAELFSNFISRFENITQIVFFRCVDQEGGALIGPAPIEQLRLGVRSYLLEGTPGECLPVVRRSAILKHRYPEDLRGFEGLAYAQIIKATAPAIVAPLVLRAYSTEEMGDRLSTGSGLSARRLQLARGYMRMARDFRKDLGLATGLVCLKAIFHVSKYICSIVASISYGRYRTPQ